MLLVSPNGVKVEACEAGAERMLANGFRKAAGKKDGQEPAEKKASEPAEKKAAKSKEG